MPISPQMIQKLTGYALANAGAVEDTVDLVDDVLSRGVSGDFMECGVASGVLCAAMAATLDAAGQSDDRLVYLCDSFDGIPKGGPLDNNMRSLVGDGGGELVSSGITRVTREQVAEHIQRWGIRQNRLRYVEGWFQHTLVPLSRGLQSRGVGLALLRIDGDLYESVKAVMETMCPLLNPGGILILDDYELDGGRLATDEWCKAHGVKLDLKPVQRAKPTCWARWPG